MLTSVYVIIFFSIFKGSSSCAETPIGTAVDYISDRFCRNISTNLANLLLEQQQTATLHNNSTVGDIHLATLVQSEFTKYPYWIQCFVSSTSPQNSSTAKERLQNGKFTITHLQNHDSTDLIDQLIDDADEASEDYIDTTKFYKDKRYLFLANVAHRCESRILKHCNWFKIGLLSHEQTHKCPACGTNPNLAAPAPSSVGFTINHLNDLNCENVIQCTSKCGEIKSINYPQNYGNNHRCRWSIRAPDTYYVNLSIIDFDIPSANNASKLGTCIFDYLTLIDGYSGKRIGCYCNENLPPPYIVSPWNELIIQFDTNSETTGRGFYFQYEFMKLALNERIKAQMSSFVNDTGTSSFAVSTVISNNVCPPGWHYFRGSCYRAYNEQEPLQWYDAESKCNSFGEGLDGHLVSIIDRDEMIVILYFLTNVWNSTRYREYYIGLIDQTREGLYKWIDNNPMSYTDWELKPMLLEDETPAQPDGGAYEDCTVIRYNSFSRTSNWHDVPCSLGKHYHSHLEKTQQINFKWDYVSSFICKSDSILTGTTTRTKARRPLFSNEFKPSLYSQQLLSHLAGTNTQPRFSKNSLATSQNASIPSSLSNKSAITINEKKPFTSSASELQARRTHLDTDEANLFLPTLDDNRYFICDNREVISTVLRCDGVTHCRDGSDESYGCGQDCLDWQFSCANGRCISIGHYCDFTDDCGDGSDESRCERLRCKLNEFKCQNGQCVPAHQRCDLLPDCSDFSDEGNSCTFGRHCNPTSTFQCYNGNCIPHYAVCDFQIDCPGKFHEDEDLATCDLLQKSQAQQNQANAVAPSSLPVWNSDTSLATVVFYPAYQARIADSREQHWPNVFKCTSGNMIDARQRCLFEFDKYGYQIGCRDVSHLMDCAEFECPQLDYVKCPNSYCIPWRYVCDGKWDCIMGDDEVGCARYICPGQYKCANQSSCILLHHLCDGHRQCPMGDDEWFCDLQCPIGCDCIGHVVYCHGANLTSLPNYQVSKSVRKLDLSNNRLGPNLSSSNFDMYHDLGELILNHNGIEVLIPRKFLQLRNLYKLDLSHNQIHSLKRGSFAGLRRVTQLLLESNYQLSSLETEAFLGLSSLQILNISSSRIQSLRKNTFDGLTSLRTLLLRNNMIVSIEDGAFRTLTSLVSLDMRGNDIRTFTKSVFTDLKSLRNLSTDSFKFCCLINQQVPADKCLPLPDEISDCEDLLSSVPQRTCIWIAGGFACIGNIIVIIWRYRDRLGQKERETQRVNSVLILSLGFSDLLMGIYLIIIAFVDSWYRGRYIENSDKWRESPLCNLCGFLSTVSSTVSVLTLAIMAYNRYLEISVSYSQSNFTLGYARRLIQLTWCAALIIATVPVLWPYFRGQFYARSGVCLAFHNTDQRAAGWLYSLLVLPIVNLFAYVLLFRCYMSIYHQMRAILRSHVQQENQEGSPLKIMLIIVVHFVAFSPPVIIGFMSLAGYSPPATLYSWIAVLVLPVNSAVNPFLYTFRDIRITVRLLMSHYKARKSGAVVDSSSKTKERLPMINQRNIPSGYIPLKQYVKQCDHIGQVVQLALCIVRDIEQKHRERRIYTSLSSDAVFVSDCIGGITSALNQEMKKKIQSLRHNSDVNEQKSSGSLVVFIADAEGYKPQRHQACSHNESSHRHHLIVSNCECNDVKRFGTILFELIQLYNHKRLAHNL